MPNVLKVFHLNETGGRSHNEDSIYPTCYTDISNNIFLVCDGVGGANKGEIASRLVCERLPESLNKERAKKITPDLVLRRITEVVQDFQEYTNLHPDAKNMATTITLAVVKEKSILVAWCGDSRIYHIRDGKVLFRSRDHSMVQNLVDIGEITEEEALVHPNKNQIFRSISEDTTPDEVEFGEIFDIEEGDYLLLCSDGLLENLNAEIIGQVFTKANINLNFSEKISSLCKEKTSDNYSMQLVIFAGAKTRVRRSFLNIFRKKTKRLS
jgi:serine/threonine protein phosphatase PrpC